MIHQGPLWHCLILVGCAVDRWVSILKPLHYESIITAKKITVFIVTSFTGTGIFVFSLFLLLAGEIDPSDKDNQTVSHELSNINLNISGTNIISNSPIAHSVTQTEYINSQNVVHIWIWTIALLGMNMITIGLYTSILFELKKQLRKIQPNIENQILQRPTNKYKGTIKLLFTMIYFTVNFGLAGFVSLLLVTGVLTVQDMSSKTFMFFSHISGVVAMTPCIINITVYGLTTKHFMYELKRFLKYK